MSEDPRGQGLVAANAAFYAAFEKLDLAAMREVWLEDASIMCIHPGWPLCRGSDEVDESWRRIFENTPYIEFGIRVIDHGIDGQHGWAVCEESILQSTPNGLSRSIVLSTNLFVELDGQWRMILHHGSPVARPVPTVE